MKAKKFHYNNLRKALLTKENAESYLDRLNELKTLNNISKPLYTTLKNEYTVKQQKAILCINEIQNELRQQLTIKLNELMAVEHEFGILENKLRAKQISSALYANLNKNFTARINQIQNEVVELKTLTEVKSSADIT